MEHDAVVVGSGPNGLTAAALVATAGGRVLVVEAQDWLGGGAHSEALTLPGFVHDTCAAVHPLAVRSPAFARLPLAEHGLELVHPDVALAHPFDDGTAAVLDRSWDATTGSLGADGDRWRSMFDPLARGYDALLHELAGPIAHVPRHPLVLARFGLPALAPVTLLARRFRGREARALFAGVAAHAMLPLSHVTTASFGLLLGAAGHAAGWPAFRRGTQSVTDALAGIVRAHGGEIVTGTPVASLADLPPARATFLDTSAPDAARIAGDVLPARIRRALARFRPGPAAFKLDYALSEPVPWRAGVARRAGTLHLGGTIEEIAASERAAARGVPDRPFVLVAQQSLFDDTRAPAGQHTLWAYCHVANGSTADMTERVEAQIERFAPGFRDVVLARHVLAPADFEARNANRTGGDIAGGALDGLQLLARPRLALDPYSLGVPGLYLCSASTPPGAGVHGMCGAAAADRALRRELR